MYKRGFTLIEVLIVVIIIGILATLLLPQMGAMAERARTAEARNMIGALRSLITVHYMDHNAFPICADTATINNTLGATIDEGSTHFEYSITAAGNDALITAVRNTHNHANGAPWTRLTLQINAAGGTESDLTIEWDNNNQYLL